MKCAVIIPVGPGHEFLYEDALDSACDAFASDRGPFLDLALLHIDDTRGERGRSAARNEGVAEAGRRGIEWIFFLDSDDVMLPQAFAAAAAYVEEYDAIWGQICCGDLHSDRFDLRPGQAAGIEGLEALLSHDPLLSLQMGHFVRTPAAAATPFDTRLDTGEDFDYYLRLWSRYRCIKITAPLFVNRRGAHSIGPRAATGREWRDAVARILAAYRSGRGKV